jgi:hypothetical protein
MFRVAMIAALALLTYGSPADAANISTCTETCSSNCTLTQNVTCEFEDGIVLTSGADLDLNGYQISCNHNCPQSAVKIAGSGSVVKSLNGPGYITGGFTYQVNCQAYATSEITGIQINAFHHGLKDCARVHNNLIQGGRGSGSIGVSTTGVANTDYIRDNWIEEFETAILANTAHDLDIEHNQIGLREITVAGPTSEVGISASTSGSADITILYNTFHGDATSADVISVSGSVDIAGNACDPDNALCTGACPECRSVGPTPPFE